MKERILRIIKYAVLVGLLALAIQIIFQIDRDVFIKYYWIFAGVFLLLVIVVNVTYSIYISKEVNEIMPLYEEGRYPEYIQKMEDLLAKTKGQYPRNYVTLNLIAGYIENKDYQKGLELSDQINPDKLGANALKAVYWINKAIAYFELEDYDRFKDIYRSQNKIIQEHRKAQPYYVDQLTVLDAIARGELEEAEEALTNLKDKWQGIYDKELADLGHRLAKARA